MNKNKDVVDVVVSKGIGKVKAVLDEIQSIEQCDIILLNDLKNYIKEKEMNKQNYKPFAVKGDIIDLLRFEKGLISLGFKCAHDKDVFNWRNAHGDPAGYITSQVHYNYSHSPGFYIPAANDGGATTVFDLANFAEWNAALKLAKQQIVVKKVLLITEDGVPKHEGDKLYYVNTKFEYKFWKSGLRENFSQKYKYFDTEIAAQRYILENKPLYSQKEMDEILTKVFQQTGCCWTIKKNYPKDFVKTVNEY